MRANELAYIAMLEEAIKHNMPTAYSFDLCVHDRLNLGIFRIPEASDPAIPEGAAFGWILRDKGTELLPLGNKEERKYTYTVAAHYGIGSGVLKDYPHRWYFWDGMTLHDTKTYDGMMERIYEYVRRNPC